MKVAAHLSLFLVSLCSPVLGKSFYTPDGNLTSISSSVEDEKNWFTKTFGNFSLEYGDEIVFRSGSNHEVSIFNGPNPERDWSNCNSERSDLIAKLQPEDGKVFQFRFKTDQILQPKDLPKKLYIFCSRKPLGEPSHCQQGQKLVVTVLPQVSSEEPTAPPTATTTATPSTAITTAPVGDDDSTSFQSISPFLNYALNWTLSNDGKVARIQVIGSGLFQGWVGLGVPKTPLSSSPMIGATALIAIDNSSPSNSKYASIALYSLNGKKTDASQIKEVEKRVGALSKDYGINNASVSFEETRTVLEFSLVLADQHPTLFTLFGQELGSSVTLIGARGGRVFGYHSQRGSFQFTGRQATLPPTTIAPTTGATNSPQGTGAPTTLTPTRKPTTSAPTTLAPTTKTPTTKSPTLDGDIPYQERLIPETTIRFQWRVLPNTLQMLITAAGITNQGSWIGIGISPTGGMIGSRALIALNKDRNPGLPQFGIYNLSSQTANPDLLDSDTFETYGIFSSSYRFNSETGLISLALDIALANQKPPLVFLNSANDPIDIVIAFGEQYAFGYHGSDRRGILKNIRLGNAATNSPTTQITKSPTTTQSPSSSPELNPNQTVTKAGIFTIETLIEDSDTVLITVSAASNGYIAIGAGPGGMLQSRAIVASTSGIRIVHLISKSGSQTLLTDNPSVMESAYGISNASVTYQGGTAKLVFVLTPSKQDANFKLVNGLNPVNVVVATGTSPSLSYHGVGNKARITTILISQNGIITNAPTTISTKSPTTISTKSPTTKSPTITVNTKSPTTKATENIVYDQFRQISNNLKFEWKLDTVQERLFAKLSVIGHDWLAVGINSKRSGMIGSRAIIGVNPSSNPGRPTIGVFDLISQDEDTQLQSKDLLNGNATKLRQLFASGIRDASYATENINGNVHANLTFEIDTLDQDNELTFIPSDPTKKINMVFAVGSGPFGYHEERFNVPNISLFPANVGNDTSSPTTSTKSPTVAPTNNGRSSDPNFDRELKNLGSEDLTLFFRTREPETLRVKFTSSHGGNSWVGFGLSGSTTGTKMIDGRVLIGLDTSANPGYPAVGLYKLKSKSSMSTGDVIASTPTDLETKYGITNTSVSFTNGLTILEFTLILAKQSADYTLKPSGGEGVNIIYANGVSSPLAYHDFKGSKSAFVFDDTAEGSPDDVYTVPSALAWHIAIMMTAWLILAPIGTSLPLFNNVKKPKQKTCGLSQNGVWFKWHMRVQITAVLLTIAGFICAVVYTSQIDSIHFNNYHQIIGLIVFLLALEQPVYGYFRPHKPKEGEVKSFSRKVFEFIHPVFGWLTVFLGIINCILGVKIFETICGCDTYKYATSTSASGYGGALGVVVLLFGSIAMFIILTGLIMRAVLPSGGVEAPPKQQEEQQQAAEAEAGAGAAEASNQPEPVQQDIPKAEEIVDPVALKVAKEEEEEEEDPNNVAITLQ